MQNIDWPVPTPPGLGEAIEAAGIRRARIDGVMKVSDLAAAEAIIAGYDFVGATRSDIKAQVAALRYEHEIAGTTLAGMPVPTDRESQGLVTGAALAATLDANYAVNWKTTAGFVALSAAQVIGLATAMRSHVQACFDREAALVGTLDALDTVADLQAVDITAGWPE